MTVVSRCNDSFGQDHRAECFAMSAACVVDLMCICGEPDTKSFAHRNSDAALPVSEHVERMILRKQRLSREPNETAFLHAFAYATMRLRTRRRASLNVGKSAGQERRHGSHRQACLLGDYLQTPGPAIPYIIPTTTLNSFFGCLIAAPHKWICTRRFQIPQTRFSSVFTLHIAPCTLIEKCINGYGMLVSFVCKHLKCSSHLKRPFERKMHALSNQSFRHANSST